MNRSNWEHVAISLLLQAVIGTFTGNLWIGAALAIGVFLGREHAQREYQITQGGPVGELPVWAGLRGWNRDSVLDFYPAVLAVVLVALLVPRLLGAVT